MERDVLCRKVRKQYYLEITNRDGYGYYFDGAIARKDYEYRPCQFFSACYGPRNSSKKQVSS